MSKLPETWTSSQWTSLEHRCAELEKELAKYMKTAVKVPCHLCRGEGTRYVEDSMYGSVQTCPICCGDKFVLSNHAYLMAENAKLKSENFDLRGQLKFPFPESIGVGMLLEGKSKWRWTPSGWKLDDGGWMDDKEQLGYHELFYRMKENELAALRAKNATLRAALPPVERLRVIADFIDAEAGDRSEQRLWSEEFTNPIRSWAAKIEEAMQ